MKFTVFTIFFVRCLSQNHATNIKSLLKEAIRDGFFSHPIIHSSPSPTDPQTELDENAIPIIYTT